MSLSPYNPHDRYRKRFMRRISGFSFFILFLGLAVSIGYWFGGLSAQQKIIMLQQERDTARTQHKQIQDEITQLRAQAQTANVRLEQVRAGYDELLPEGPMQNLVELLKKQLDEGIDEKRLRSVILSARPPQNCSEPVNRAVVITTPAYKGPESKISIESGTITIWGEGQSVINEHGKQEAWFDPTKPITINFMAMDGKIQNKQGVLPMHASQVVGSKEYRFTITQGEKSFAKITYDYCDYP